MLSSQFDVRRWARVARHPTSPSQVYCLSREVADLGQAVTRKQHSATFDTRGGMGGIRWQRIPPPGFIHIGKTSRSMLVCTYYDTYCMTSLIPTEWQEPGKAETTICHASEEHIQVFLDTRENEMLVCRPMVGALFDQGAFNYPSPPVTGDLRLSASRKDAINQLNSRTRRFNFWKL